MKNNKLKNFIKKHNYFVKVINSYSSGELEANYQNKFLGDFFKNGKIELKELDYICFDTAIENLNITNQDAINLIKEEVDGDNSYRHATDLIWSEFEDAIKKEYYYEIYTRDGANTKPLVSPLFSVDFYGYGLAYIKSDLFEMEQLKDIECCNEYYTEIKNKKDFFENVRLYKKHNYDVYQAQKDCIDQIIYYIREFKRRLKSMGDACIQWNNSIDLAQCQFEADIENYIEDHNLIINGDLSKIKFDYIDRIDGDKIITNKGAIAPLAHCKKALEVYKKGENIEGLRLGAYTIKKIFSIKDNVFFRAGCHLVKIDDNLINQLT